MKTFYNEVNSIIRCPMEARASIVLNIKLVQLYLSCKIVKNCRSIGLNRTKKSKICPRSVKTKQRLIVLCISDVMYKKNKRLTCHQICWQDFVK